MHVWTIRELRCPFSGKPREYTSTKASSRKSAPSQKVACKASIKVWKKFNEDKITVRFNKTHSGHDPLAMKTFRQMKMAPCTKNWLEKVLAKGTEWNAFQALTRENEAGLKSLEAAAQTPDVPVKVPLMTRVTYNDFQNCRRSHTKSIAQLDPEC